MHGLVEPEHSADTTGQRHQSIALGLGIPDYVHRLVVSEGPTALASMKHYATAVLWPRQEHRSRNRNSPEYDPNRAGVKRQPRQEVLGAIQRVQHPHNIGSDRFVFLILFAQYAVLRKPSSYGLLEVILRLLVSVSDRVGLLVVLVLHVE